ncbi:MinD/ParA family protein [Borrelia miyamotoi]|uniref:MinD/ParA family protein n=1 Tax=Borrelia miyamotoi TaxID=47466 RepID=A0AAP8YS60_9SPIR|nr:MinD/ParA family protein [Borrelia miyamotoi]AHH05054.1 ATP-binding protein [Borrelia miyamotoi FR64b]ATQ14851.1 MinD/ParA family protein [Borrelia miyamotoi]ATQ16033.1 MinD/ParA family protein [Borrelia miyamotoi]ATQ17179.1 MinD/ParA family protein [Borrelia miyamotoi]ATQ18315.1 MinD/ParA family protein [Borrelia miyamotoi]
MIIIPVASGKGGVGKSLFSANIAICLANEGKKVLLVDLDLGGSNLHSMLNIIPKKSIGTFLKTKIPFNNIIIESNIKNLSFIAGDSDIPELANIAIFQKKRIINNLKNLNYDYLIIDLGAGTTFNTIDFFLMSNRGVIVTIPTVTATMNAYLFLKNAIFRLISKVFIKETKAYKIISDIKKDSSDLQKIYIPNLLLKIEAYDPDNYAKFMKIFSQFSPFIIFNMLNTPDDIKKTEKILKSAKNYLNVNLQSIGSIYKDELVDKALNYQIPITIYKPTSLTSKSMQKIAKKLIELEIVRNNVELLSEDDLNENYHFIIKEAQNEYLERYSYLESLLMNKTIDNNAIIDIIKSQQREIAKLRKQNMMLKKKLFAKLKKD